MAERDAPLELISSPEDGEPVRDTKAVDAEPPPLTGDDLPKVFRERASNQQKMRAAAFTGLIWGGVAVAVVLVLVCLVVFRESVARAMPSTAAAYAAIGLPVNVVGLTIEGVHAEPALQDGHAALSVAMTVRNVTDHAVVSPPLSIVLLNAQGKRVGGQIVRPANPRIPPGEQRFFATAVLDPPLTAHDMEVTFALDAVGKIPVAKAVRSAAVSAAAPALRGATSPEEPAGGPLTGIPPSATAPIPPPISPAPGGVGSTAAPPAPAASGPRAATPARASEFPHAPGPPHG